MMMPYLHNSCITEGYIYDTDTYVQTMIYILWINYFSRTCVPHSLPRDRACDEIIYF